MEIWKEIINDEKGEKRRSRRKGEKTSLKYIHGVDLQI